MSCRTHGNFIVRKRGTDVTVVAISYLMQHAMDAAAGLARDGIDCEVIDLRTIKPLDKGLLLDSVKKTGRLVVADVGWKSFGMAAEISAMVFEEVFDFIKSPAVRVTLPDAPAPASGPLEAAYYPGKKDIKKAIIKTLL